MDYNKSIKKSIKGALGAMIPGMRLSNQALNCVAGCLIALNEKLVQSCRKSARKSKAIMPVEVAYNAVEREFPSVMQSLAFAAGSKAMLVYDIGLMSYTPPTKRKVLQKKKPGKTPKVKTEFLKGVAIVSDMVHPDATLNKDAKALMAMIFQQVTMSFIEKAHDLAQHKDTLETSDILKTVDGYLGSTMAKHAIAEGSKNCFLYANGLGKYTLDELAENQRKKAERKRRNGVQSKSDTKKRNISF